MTFKQRLVTALEAMPVKELGIEIFYDGECYCAVGALLHHEGHNIKGPSFVLLKVPMDCTEETFVMNDGFKGTNAERYAHMLKWAKA